MQDPFSTSVQNLNDHPPKILQYFPGEILFILLQKIFTWENLDKQNKQIEIIMKGDAKFAKINILAALNQKFRTGGTSKGAPP